MVTSHFILIEFGHDDHITFRNSLETRLASLRKIHKANGKFMDKLSTSQPSLTGKCDMRGAIGGGISG